MSTIKVTQNLRVMMVHAEYGIGYFVAGAVADRYPSLSELIRQSRPPESVDFLTY